MSTSSTWEIGLETTLKRRDPQLERGTAIVTEPDAPGSAHGWPVSEVYRPIVNTRDEPHADPERFRRVHVTIGDANMSEVCTFLKVGSCALVLSMIEDGFLPDPRTLAKPIKPDFRSCCRAEMPVFRV